MSGPVAGAMQTQVLAPTYRPLTVHGSITHSLPARALINLTFGAAILLHGRISKILARQLTLDYAGFNCVSCQWVPSAMRGQ